MDWVDTPLGSGKRDRCVAGPVPEQLPLLDADHRALLQRWAGNDSARRGRAALLGEAGPAAIERAEALCERLLREGWVVRRERLVGGSWQWDVLCLLIMAFIFSSSSLFFDSNCAALSSLVFTLK